MTKKRIEHIEKELLTLENGDNRLMTNGNGNLQRYEALKAELAVLSHKYARVKIRCVETGQLFDSAAIACRFIKCSKSAMSNHLSGRFPSLRGMHYEQTTVLSPKSGGK